MDLFGSIVTHNCLACGRVHDGARDVTLADGTTVSSYSEAWRLECEARGILALPKLADRHARLAKVENRRGAKAAEELRDHMLVIWNARQAARIDGKRAAA